MGRGSISTGQTITASDALFLGKSKVITALRANLASGQVAYTGVSFEPRTIFSFAFAAGWQSRGSIGFADENLAGRDFFAMAEDGSDNSVGFGGEAYLVSFFESVSAKTNYQRAVLQSMDTDGFTLDWTRGGVGAECDLAFLCLG